MRGSRSPATAVWLIVSSVLCVFLLIWGLAEIQNGERERGVARPAASST